MVDDVDQRDVAGGTASAGVAAHAAPRARSSSAFGLGAVPHRGAVARVQQRARQAPAHRSESEDGDLSCGCLRMLDAFDNAGKSVAAVAGVDLAVDEALHDIDELGADILPRLASTISLMSENSRLCWPGTV